ncbi:MAG: TolC family protein, partial [Gemmataceae bacterium]
MFRFATFAAATIALATHAAWGQVPATLPAPRTMTPAPEQGGLGLNDLIQLTLEQNPRLGEAAFAIDVFRGRAIQAGLYPNPTVEVKLDELGDVTGPAGVNSLPAVSQEIVTAGKLRLSRSAAMRQVDQATLALLAERFARFSAVRQGYFDVLTLQRRITILQELVKLAEESVERTDSLFKAKQVARLDVVQLEIELERFRADLEATQRELPAAYRRLAASVGVQNLPYAPILGSLEIP